MSRSDDGPFDKLTSGGKALVGDRVRGGLDGLALPAPVDTKTGSFGKGRSDVTSRRGLGSDAPLTELLRLPMAVKGIRKGEWTHDRTA